MPKDLVFFGNERLASGCTTKLPILNALINSEHPIKLIVISEKGTKSRNKRELEVEEFAAKHNIELFIPKNTQELKNKLTKVNAEVGVLAAYGKIISQEIINTFPDGIINLHPSLLPKYRGPTPIESAILSGDEKTGVSIMALSSGMDSGPIYSQVELGLNGKESKQELVDSLGMLGSIEIIKVLTSGQEPKPQNGTPTICSLIQKSDSNIDLSKPAKVLEREVRAYLGWPGSKLKLELANGKELEIIVTNSRVEKPIGNQQEQVLTADRHFMVKTSKDYLEILSLKLPGKKEITAAEFLNGYSKVIKGL